MSLNRLKDESAELMNLTNAAAWTSMSAEQRREALVRAAAIEGRIRELAGLHNKALTKLLRQLSDIPAGQALHVNELPPGEVLREMLSEIELLSPEHYLDASPDEAVRGVPENVAYFYHLAKNVHDQAEFLAVEADMRHERRRGECTDANNEPMIGLA